MQLRVFFGSLAQSGASLFSLAPISHGAEFHSSMPLPRQPHRTRSLIYALWRHWQWQMRPNPSLNYRTHYGGPSWPGLGYAVHFPNPGQAVPPQRSG